MTTAQGIYLSLCVVAMAFELAIVWFMIGRIRDRLRELESAASMSDHGFRELMAEAATDG